MNEQELSFGTILAIGGGDLSEHCDFPFMGNEVERVIREAFEPIDAKKLNGWKLDIIIVYKRARDIYFCKSATTVPSDKTKEFALRLAVPTREQASYGFNEKKFSYDEAPTKGFFVIPPNFENYDSLESYFIDSARRTMAEVLKHGLTVNGEKIKYL